MVKKLFNPNSYTYFLSFTLVICIVFILLRTLHLPESIGFGSDAGRDYLVIWNLFQNKDITLLGPPSQYSFNGKEFFFGPAPYYVMLPGLLIGNWDVIFSSYYLIFINLAIFVIGLFILERGLKKDEKFVLYPYAIFCAVTPVFVDYSRTYWNPYFMLPISMILVPLLVLVRHRIMGIWLAVLFGFLFGIGMQFHYSFIFTIAVSLIFLLRYRKLKMANIGFIVIGFIIGFSPIIIFELSKAFYNTRTIIEVLTNWEKSVGPSNFPFYYFISLLPFVFILISYGLSLISKRSKLYPFAFLVLYMTISLLFIIPVPTHGYGMVEGWNYITLKRMADAISNDKPQSYNVVDQLTRDNRAMALRYLLTTRNNAPKSIYAYDTSNTLYIYSNEPLSTLLSNPNYEIRSALPLKLIDTKHITEKIYLYTLGEATPQQ
jgi:hypothetical protein